MKNRKWCATCRILRPRKVFAADATSCGSCVRKKKEPAHPTLVSQKPLRRAKPPPPLPAPIMQEAVNLLRQFAVKPFSGGVWDVTRAWLKQFPEDA